MHRRRIVLAIPAVDPALEAHSLGLAAAQRQRSGQVDRRAAAGLEVLVAHHADDARHEGPSAAFGRLVFIDRRLRPHPPRA
jgi:hypothetical protein